MNSETVMARMSRLPMISETPAPAFPEILAVPMIIALFVGHNCCLPTVECLRSRQIRLISFVAI